MTVREFYKEKEKRDIQNTIAAAKYLDENIRNELIAALAESDDYYQYKQHKSPPMKTGYTDIKYDFTTDSGSKLYLTFYNVRPTSTQTSRDTHNVIYDFGLDKYGIVDHREYMIVSLRDSGDMVTKNSDIDEKTLATIEHILRTNLPKRTSVVVVHNAQPQSFVNAVRNTLSARNSSKVKAEGSTWNLFRL